MLEPVQLEVELEIVELQPSAVQVAFVYLLRPRSTRHTAYPIWNRWNAAGPVGRVSRGSREGSATVLSPFTQKVVSKSPTTIL